LTARQRRNRLLVILIVIAIIVAMIVLHMAGVVGKGTM
jgi:cytochrome c-type biogenesis protein CcmE